jgi:cobaltochelatase CobS
MQTLLNTPASASRIKSDALAIRSDNPRLATGQYVSQGLRERLEALAEAAGMPRDVARCATDNDLIGIWSVAYRDGAMASRVASRVAARIAPASAPASLLDPAPTGTPAAPAGVGLDVVRDLIRAEVRDGALEPLQRALEGLDASLRGDFASLLAGANANAITALREVIEAEAALAATEAVKAITPTLLSVARDPAPPVALGLAHFRTAEVIDALADGVNVYLYGPAGSGKTTVAAQVAKAFGVEVYYAAKVENEYALIGYTTAGGVIVRTAFRDAYEYGGVFLFDEFDASASQAVVALNMALANGVCAFPDKVVTRHPDFKCIAAGNTKLGGATRLYNGRTALDGASIDRFAFIDFPYDDDLERALAPDAAWCAYVQRVRAVVAERELPHLVTPRATYDGCKLLASGKRTFDQVAAMVIWKGLDDDTVAQIKAAL